MLNLKTVSSTVKISVLRIVEDTTVDGPGFRTSVYAAGCTHHCQGCHNPESWDFDNGTWMETEEILEIIQRNLFSQVSFSGGDPLCQAEGFTALARCIKKETGKNIWCYTGFTYEKICRTPLLSGILPYIDVLVDGRFVVKKKDLSLVFRGSSNQRLIDVPASLRTGKTVLWERNSDGLL